MFKDVLKELRNKKGLLQDELGEIIGNSKSAIGMYETGQRMPNDKTLKKLSEYFGVTIDYLFGFEQEKLLMRKEKILLNEKEEDLIIAVRNKKEMPEILQAIRELNERLKEVIRLNENNQLLLRSEQKKSELPPVEKKLNIVQRIFSREKKEGQTPSLIIQPYPIINHKNFKHCII